jgi:hypothetical protein
MIIISSSQDLEDNPNLVIIDCINKSFGHFFLSANWESASTGQNLPSSVQSLPTCDGLHLWGKVLQLWGVIACLKEEILLSLNLTPVTNTPWKHCNLTSCVTQSQSHLCQHQSDLFIILFLRELCAILHLPTTICILCVHKKKQTWPFLPEICYSIVSAWS